MIARRTVLGAGGLVVAQSLVGRVRASAPGQLLFDGRSLAGWRYHEGGRPREVPRHIVTRAGELHVLADPLPDGAEVPFGYLATDRSFADFHLRLDYRWGPARYAPRALAKRNSGVMYHLSPSPDPGVEHAIEFQIQESNVGDIIAINARALEAPQPGGTPAWPEWPSWVPRTYAEPSIAGGISRQWFRGAGDFELRDRWNRLDVIAYRDQAAHLVNGRIVAAVYGLRATSATGMATADPLMSGRIALQIEAAQIAFRNIRIRPISHPMDLSSARD
ncbi:3-keto-disaccharide hydrolase [Sphingomonas sp.]|uniref:3-keto-disaccharide hydrolase n=1 Tax=Sphingomonas sp. TaxID=28214 RepID=UPI003BA91DAA